MDTMEWTKIFGGLCGSLLIFLLIQWGAESIYHVSDNRVSFFSVLVDSF